MFCFRNDSRMATMMPVSSVSRKTIKKTGVRVRRGGGDEAGSPMAPTWDCEDVHGDGPPRN